MDGHRATALTSFIVAVILTGIWVVQRRRARGAKGGGRGAGTVAADAEYTGAQLLGIAGIIVVLLPIFLGISVNLARGGTRGHAVARGGMILLAFLFEVLHLPQPVKTVLSTLCSVAAMFTALSFTYFLCEAVWPEKHAPRPGSDPADDDPGARQENPWKNREASLERPALSSS